MVTVIDNDVPSIAVSFGQASHSVAEGASTTIRVVLDKDPERSVAIPIVISHGGGATSTDYSGVPDVIALDAGETESMFTLTAAQDAKDDDDESVILSFGALPEAVNNGPTSRTTVSIVDDDEAGVSVEPTRLPLAEGATSTYLVVLQSQPKADVTVTVNEPVGNSDVIVTPKSLTFTTYSWSAALPVTVTAQQDDDGDDDTETLTHTITSTDPNYDGIEASPVEVIVTDDDDVSVKVGFAQGSYSVTEGSTTTVTVVLDRDPERTISIPINTDERDGATESDYSGIPTSVDFNAGETERSFTVAAISDSIDDDGESLRLSLVDLPQRVSIGVFGTTTLNIIDEDVPTIAVSFERSTYVVSEGSVATVSVVLDGPPERSIAIPIINTALGGAMSTDYSGVPHSVNLDPSDTQKAFTFSATQDAVDDDGESVRLTFGLLPNGVMRGSRSEATVNIADDDVPSVNVSFDLASYSVLEGATTSIKFSLNADPERSVTIALVSSPQGGVALDDYSGIPADVTFNSGETEHSFTFYAIGDDIDDDGEAIRLSFTSPLPPDVTGGTPSQSIVQIIDDDIAGVTVYPSLLRIEEQATSSYTLVLDSRPTHDVTVTISPPTGGKIVTDKPRLTFTSSDWHMPQNVTVTANPDSDTDDYEGKITHTIDSSDSKYDRITPGSVTVTVIDNDVPMVTVSFGQASYSVAEGATTTVKVMLDRDPERNVTIPIVTTASGGATSTDFSGVPDIVGFVSGATDGTFTFTATQDPVDDDDESVILTFGELPEAVNWGAVAETTVSIVDDDVPAVTVSFERGTYSVEEGATTSVRLVLDRDPERVVTIPITSTQLNGATSSDNSGVPIEVVFSPGDTKKSFTFIATQDSQDDDDESVRLSISDLPDQVLTGMHSEALFSIVDDDVPIVDVSFDQAMYSLEEGSNTTVTVHLSALPERALDIALGTTHLDGITDADYGGVLNIVSFSPNSTEASFALSATEDDIDDDGESLLLTLGPSLPPGVTSEGLAQTTVVLVDDDTANVIVRPSSLTIDERATSTYSVMLSSQPTHGVTLHVHAPGETEISTDKDQLIFATSTWNLPQTVTVTAGTDEDTNDDEGIISHTIVTHDDNYAGIAPGSVEVNVIDNDVPSVTVTFGMATYRVNEGDVFTVEVILDIDPERTLTIPIEKVHQGGVTSADYAGVPDSVTFNSGETVASFTVSTLQDTLDDDFELVKLSFLDLPEGVSVGTYKETAISITDDDVPSIAVTFGSGNYRVREGDEVSIRVALNRDPERTLTIPIERSNRSGATTRDYAGVPRAITFNSGETEKLFTLVASQDSQVEGSEAVRLSLGDLPDGASRGVFGDSTVTIVDDDLKPVEVTFLRNAYEAVEGSPVTIRVRLSDDPLQTLRIPIVHTSINGATRSDYSGVPRSLTFNARDTEKSFTLTALEDFRNEGDEAIVLSFGTLPAGVEIGRIPESTVTITDAELAMPTVSFEYGIYTLSEGSTTTITVLLSESPEEAISIPIDVFLGDGATSTDYLGVPANVTLESGETETSFDFHAVEDFEDEDGESIRLGIRNLPETVAAGPFVEATVFITDAVMPLITVSFGHSAYSLKGGSTTTVNVILEGDPRRPITIPIVVVNPSSSTTIERVDEIGSLTFGQDVTQESLEISAEHFKAFGDVNSLVLTFGALPDEVNAGAVATTTIWIGEEGSSGRTTLTFVRPNYVVVEGSSVEIRMLLSAPPTDSVTVPLAWSYSDSLSTGAFSDLPMDVTFDAGVREAGFSFTATRNRSVNEWESVLLNVPNPPKGMVVGEHPNTRIFIQDGAVFEALQRAETPVHDCHPTIRTSCLFPEHVSVVGNLVPRHDVDWFKMELQENATYAVTRSLNPVNLDLLQGQAREPLARANAALPKVESANETTIFKVPMSGIYYLEVSWPDSRPYFVYSSSYQLELVEVPLETEQIGSRSDAQLMSLTLQ